MAKKWIGGNRASTRELAKRGKKKRKRERERERERGREEAEFVKGSKFSPTRDKGTLRASHDPPSGVKLSFAFSLNLSLV